MHTRSICPAALIVALGVALGATAGCVGSGDVPTQVSGQIVGIDERPLGPGLVVIEQGEIHEGFYKHGAVIDENGRWTSELSGGGTWGLHLFHDEYVYIPVEITIEDNQQVELTNIQIVWGDWMDRTGLPTWPDQPSNPSLMRMPYDDNFDDNPVLESVSMQYLDDELMEITIDAFDPDGDLSRMILAFDSATGGGLALTDAPGPPDGLGNYPNGTYRTTVFVDERDQPGETLWHFIVVDNNCNNSPIVKLVMPPR